MAFLCVVLPIVFFTPIACCASVCTTATTRGSIGTDTAFLLSSAANVTYGGSKYLLTCATRDIFRGVSSFCASVVFVSQSMLRNCFLSMCTILFLRLRLHASDSPTSLARKPTPTPSAPRVALPWHSLHAQSNPHDSFSKSLRSMTFKSRSAGPK